MFPLNLDPEFLWEVFLQWVCPHAKRECWLWMGAAYKGTQYGLVVLRTNGRQRQVAAHRFSWMLSRSRIPIDLDVLHKCDNPRCVNPHHLWLGTQADNNRDRHRKGRTAWGEQAGNVKLTQQQALVVFRFQGKRTPKAAKEFGKKFRVTDGAIRAIWEGRSWRRLAKAEELIRAKQAPVAPNADTPDEKVTA